MHEFSRWNKLMNLGGGSGCEVCLLGFGNRQVVKKTSANVRYNERLVNQASKQIELRNNGLLTPEIYSLEKESDGRIAIYMEYIRGQSVSNALAADDINLCDLEWFLAEYFEKMSNKVDESEGQLKAEMRQKTQELKSELCSFDGLVNEILIEIDELVVSNNVEEPNCCWSNHGDLTFQNLIQANPASRPNYYLIDTLDAYTSNLVLDFSTLYQEFMVKWSWFDHARGNLDISVACLLKLSRLESRVAHIGKELFGPSFEFWNNSLLCLNLLRALRYTNLPAKQNFLLDQCVKTRDFLCRFR